MTSGGLEVAIGIRPRTGWAMLVAVTGLAGPRVLLRQRVELLGDAGPLTRFVYHQAAELGSLEAAETFVADARCRVEELARQALEAARTKLGAGAAPGLGVVAAPPRLAAPLAGILKAHMKIHGAEGVFYPEAWIAAGKALGMRVLRAPEKDLVLTIASRCDADEAEVAPPLKAMGAPLGPPWDADCRLAAGAAWAALGG